MAKQLEFLFTETGANQRYLEHQLADMKSRWLSLPEPKLPLKLYRAKYISDGLATQFSNVWRPYYFANVVENQTGLALKRFVEYQLIPIPKLYKEKLSE